MLDFDVHLNFEDWANSKWIWSKKRKSSKDLHFKGMLELERFLKGYDPSHGNMKGFAAEASDESKKAMRWIFDKRHRTIDYDFERKITSDNNVTKRIAEHG